MALKIFVALDLGSDTLKIAYAYKAGRISFGKIVGDPDSMTAIPAVAYYDFDDNRWLFGEQVNGVGDKSFMGVVKIKYLISLLNGKYSNEVNEHNQTAYFNGNHFPKFYFPLKKKLPADFSKAVADRATFEVKGFTPSRICQDFFSYVNLLVKKSAEKLAKRAKEKDFEIIPSVIHPQYSSKQYISELERLVSCGFGASSYKTLSLTKALCAYAMQTKRIRKNESVLIFNIGEEQISVVKASLINSGLSVDGADGHNDPENLGGNDIDDAVAMYLEREISRRESMGRPSCGSDGYLAEGSLNAKQYLFVKDIKSAKVILGMSMYEKSAFKNGVPVCVSRDLYIQRNITRESFAECIGITGDTGVARQIADYMEREADRPVNGNISKIFLTGGPVETYGLVNYLKNKFSARGIGVYTFENADESYEGLENDGFNILAHEDALYAPALGGALAALNNIDIETVLALSYGLRLFLYEGDVPYLELLVNKGDALPPDGAKFFTPRPEDRIGLTTSRDSVESAPMHIMSTILTREDISAGKYASRLDYVTTANGLRYLKCNPSDRVNMQKLQKHAGLKVINGNSKDLSYADKIYYYYNRTRVRLIDKVYAVIGVKIDGEGRARPFAENDTSRNGDDFVTIEYLWDIRKNGKLLRRAGDVEKVRKSDIVFDFDMADLQLS